jgi:hypothetical protein
MRINFSLSGLATLKIRVPCKQTNAGTKLLDVKIKLTENTENLQQLIANETKIPPNRIKLISAGKVLAPHKTLTEQNIKNYQQILALELSDESKAVAEDQAYDRIQKIRMDAEKLLKNNNQDYFKVFYNSIYKIHVPHFFLFVAIYSSRIKMEKQFICRRVNACRLSWHCCCTRKVALN